MTITDWIQAICAVLPFINKDSKEQKEISKKQLELNEKGRKDTIRPDFWFVNQSNIFVRKVGNTAHLHLINTNQNFFAKSFKITIDNKNLPEYSELSTVVSSEPHYQLHEKLHQQDLKFLPRDKDFNKIEIRFKDEDGNSYKQILEYKDFKEMEMEKQYIISAPEEIN